MFKLYGPLQRFVEVLQLQSSPAHPFSHLQAPHSQIPLPEQTRSLVPRRQEKLSHWQNLPVIAPRGSVLHMQTPQLHDPLPLQIKSGFSESSSLQLAFKSSLPLSSYNLDSSHSHWLPEKPSWHLQIPHARSPLLWHFGDPSSNPGFPWISHGHSHKLFTFIVSC